MSDSILDEENNYGDDIAESVSKSCDSKSKKKFNTNLGGKIIRFKIVDKKKIRRSRIIINDTNDIINDNKKEIYDSETKLKKSILSAVCFNENLNMNRKETSKVFLKRKIKAAFEREPIDKNKAFFNVSFIPIPGMFSGLPSTQHVQNPLPPQQASRPVNFTNLSHSHNPNIPPKITSNQHPNTQNIPKNDQTIVINLNKSKEDCNTNISINPSQSTNINLVNKNPSIISSNNPTNISTHDPPNYDTAHIPKNISSNQNQTSNTIFNSVSQSRNINPINTHMPGQNKLAPSSTTTSNSKHLFNVNQSHTIFGDASKNSLDMTKAQSTTTLTNPQSASPFNSFNINLSEEKEIKYQINASNLNKIVKNTNIINNNNTYSTPDVKINEPGKISINPTQIQQQGLNLLSLTNLTSDEIKKLKPEQIDQINRAIRQKAQLQQLNMNNSNNNLNGSNKLNITGNPVFHNQPNPSNNNLAELIRQQQSSIYIQVIESFKNDPEKFKSDATTNELIKLQKLITISKMPQDQINSNYSNSNFVVSNIIPKEGINNSYQLNLQLLQSIQKQIHRREPHQNQANNLNNNLNSQNSKITNPSNMISRDIPKN